MVTKKTAVLKKHAMLLACCAATVVSIVAAITTYTIAVRYNTLENNYSLLKQGYTLQPALPTEDTITSIFTLRLDSLTKDQVGIPGYLEPTDTTQFVTIDMTIKNRSEEDQLFIPLNHMYARDEKGIRYDITNSPTAEKPIAGVIAAGDTAHGQVGFVVPRTITKFVVYFQPYGVDNHKTIAIDASSLL